MFHASIDCRTKKPSAQTEIVGIFQNEKGKTVFPRGTWGKLIKRLEKSEVPTSSPGAVHFLRFGGRGPNGNLVFVGMGKWSGSVLENSRRAGAHLFQRLKKEKASAAVVHVETLAPGKGAREEASQENVSYALAEGIALASYRFQKQVRSKTNDQSLKITFFAKQKGVHQDLNERIRNLKSVQECVGLTRDWSNQPSNIGTPVYFAGESKKHAKNAGVSCKVVSQPEIERQKMRLLLGVSQGSTRPPRVTILDYKPRGAAAKKAKTIVFVGKGVTFDSGGISLKPSLRMEEMKHDMTGAATVTGAALLAARMKVPNRVICICGFVENMPAGDAIQPGNVIQSRSGKTVEVVNTDAEGRLVLADLLDYAQTFRPDVIVDAATLTGAVGVALGKHCCAALGNHSVLADQVIRSGQACGEKVWQLPNTDEYFEDMKSDYADLKNAVNNPLAGTIRGGIFLKQFVKSETPWLHLDIAYTAWDMGHIPYYPKKGGSGAYVRTLAHFAKNFQGFPPKKKTK